MPPFFNLTGSGKTPSMEFFRVGFSKPSFENLTFPSTSDAMNNDGF